jgi:DNA-binding response OmpR family regulator
MNRTILHVENDFDYAKLIGGILKKKGHNVVHASCGRKGLKLLKHCSPDIVLLGIIMPDIDGFTFAEIARESDPTLPIVFLTSLSDPKNEIKGLKLGACDYICKEADLDVVLARIEKELKRCHKRYISIQLTPDTSIDTKNKMLIIREKRHKLGMRDFDLLMLLCDNINMVQHRKIIEQTIWGENANSTQYLYKATYNLRKILQYDPTLSIDTFRNGDIVLNNTSASRIPYHVK